MLHSASCSLTPLDLGPFDRLRTQYLRSRASPSGLALNSNSTGDDRLRQRDYQISIASVRDGNGSRYPLVARTIATANVPEVFKRAFAKMQPAMALA